MSIIASIPVLENRSGTQLSVRPDGLLLRSRHESLTIPGEAVARVRAEGGSVAVELRALPGAAPVVHGIEGVDQAAAVAFADGVNSLLIEPDEEVDGTASLVLHSLRTRRSRRAVRRSLWHALGWLGAIIALSVICGMAGGTIYPVFIVLIGSITGLFVVVGAHELGSWAHRRRVRKHGVREFASPSNRPGAYIYTDGAGMHRTVSHHGSTGYVEVAYDPADPADVFTMTPGLMELFAIWVGASAFVCGLGGVVGLILITVDALSGSTLAGSGP